MRRPPTDRDDPGPTADLVGLAAIFSFLVPGLGHLFLGSWLRAVVWFAGWLVVSDAGGGGVHPFVVVLMVIAGLDALLSERADDQL
jgi:hypothetical protein